MFESEMTVIFIRNHFCYCTAYAVEDYFVSGCEFTLISLLHSTTCSELMSCVDAAGGVYMEDLHHSVLDIWLIYDWESLNEEREELDVLQYLIPKLVCVTPPQSALNVKWMPSLEK